MRKQKILFFILFFLFCIVWKNYSQVNFQITTGTLQGCVPLNVHFIGVAGATNPSWNFGAGQGSSVLDDPSNIYNTAGTYTVTYNATVGGNPVSHVATVTVFPKPTGTLGLGLPPSHCNPMTVTLTASGAPSGSSYNFTFGDGGQSSGSPAVHTYNISNSFVPTLVITDSHGCQSLAITNGTVHVSLPPTIVIGSTGLNSCAAPFTTAFTATNSTSGSPTGGSLSYNWNFGGGTPAAASQANPGNVTYSSQGHFTITLTGTDNNSCSASTQAFVNVVQPAVSATVPAVVCVGSAFSATVSSTEPSTLWNMGNGSFTTFSITNPGGTPTVGDVYTYGSGSSGTKTIVISAVLGACTASVSKVVTVQEITPQFTFSPLTPTLSCGPTMLATVINQTTVNPNATLNYSWSLYQPISENYNHIYPNVPPSLFLIGNVTNPTFTLTQGSNNPYTIYQPFSPKIKLVVTSSNGCTADIAYDYFTLQRPTAAFYKNKSEGCSPLVVKFTDASVTNTAFPVTSYTWNNGANPATIVSGAVTPPNPIPEQTFTYTSLGTYTPFLTIQTQGGCGNVSFVDTVVVSNAPSNFSLNVAPNLTVCAGLTLVTVTLQAVSGQTVNHWHVTSDNGFYSGCVSNSTPSFPFTHTGVHNFTVSASQRGCAAADLASTQSVTVYGPYGKFRFETNCANTSSVNFYSYLQDVQTATLNFGDAAAPQVIIGNSGGVLSHTVAHTYAASGDYTISLVSVNASHACAQQTYTQIVRIRHAQAAITNTLGLALPALPNPLVCTRQNVQFSGATSTDVATSCYGGSDYAWFFTAPVASVTLTSMAGASVVTNKFPVAGIYTVALRVRDINGCQSTDIKQFRVSGANPQFLFSANPICASAQPVQIINTTSQVAPDQNDGFWWDFGNGSTTFTTTSTSTFTYNYGSVSPPSQNFNVQLIAKNTFGCKDTISKIITINNPLSSLLPSPFQYGVCVPKEVTFIAPTGYNTYSITYSDSTASLVKPNPVFKHKYTASGNYSIHITIVDAAGCSNSSQINNFVARVKPEASFTTVGTANFCSPATITFTSTSTTTDNVYSPITNYAWDLGSGLIPTNTSSVVNVFASPGITTVSLVVYPDGAYCADTAAKTIYVYDTKGTLVLNKTKFCLGETIKASIVNTQDAGNWQCNVGFGIQPSATPLVPTQTVSYTYTNSAQTGTVNVVATINSPSNSCVIADTKSIEIVNINAGFIRNLEQTLTDTVHCAKIPDSFTIGVNTSGASMTYSWNFGDGSTSSDPNPSHTYSVGGVWAITLTVRAPDIGCQGSSVKNMTIYPLPTISLTTEENCPNIPFVINGSLSQGVISGTWSPAADIIGVPEFTTSGLSFTSQATASVTSDFSLSVTDVNNCISDEIVQNVIIIQPPPNIHWDTTIVIGQTVALNSDYGSGYTYSWTPVFTDLSCQYCPLPVSSSTSNITYSVMVEDYKHCTTIENIYTITIRPLANVDVPTAFTPNGDGVNDVIYAVGWGVKKLNYFRIYNRWGQLLFETNDVKIGWDGVFGGAPQNMETYVYQISAETYIDEKPFLKTGTFKLIR